MRSFSLLARWRNATGQIHAGEYLFEVSATPDQVLDRLVAGDIRKFQITIPEGFNLREIADRLEETGIGSAEEFLALCNNDAFIEELGVKATSLEGYLFPETYTYSSSTTPRQLLRAMVEQLDSHITADLLESAAALDLDRHQLITLASIVQKEAGNLMEMPLISSVFHNRLKLGMPLQADPTVIYGIADFDGNLTRKHLNTPTPYNTYRMRGLASGPDRQSRGVCPEGSSKPCRGQEPLLCSARRRHPRVQRHAERAQSSSAPLSTAPALKTLATRDKKGNSYGHAYPAG